MTPFTRRGFTLVELLVVSGMMAALLALALTTARPSATTQVRQLAQNVSSGLLLTQTRAIGHDHGAALILEPGTNGAPDFACNAVFQADVLPYITGSVASGMPPVNLNATSTSVSLSPSNADVADLQSGYKIRFFSETPFLPRSPWMALMSGSSVRFRLALSQDKYNTPWPVAPLLGSLQFEAARYPRKASWIDPPTRQAAIDLRYSGVGNSIVGDYGSLATKGDITICFDRNGSLDEVMRSLGGIEPIVPEAAVYLLVASMADIQSGRSLQSETSRWIAIAPSTGRTTLAANISVSGTSEADVYAARANARSGIAGGVR